MPTEFSARLVPYAVFGSKLSDPFPTLPATEFEGSFPFSDVSALSAKVSEAVYGALPDLLELGFEVNYGAGWFEVQGGRFLINGDRADDASPEKLHDLQGVNIWGWFLNKCQLEPRQAYEKSGITSIDGLAVPGITVQSASPTLLRATAHGFAVGDLVTPTALGTAKKGIEKGSNYYVIETTTNTFRVSGSINGGAREIGAASGIALSRRKVVLRAPGHLFINNELVKVIARGGADNVTVWGEYYAVKVTTNTLQLADSPNGTPIAVGNVDGMVIRRALDGDRRFNSSTPGYILKKMIDEAKDRGWGPGLSYDFTHLVDSAGTPWPKSFTLAVKPYTNGLVLLNLLRDNGWVEVAFDGRTMHAWPAGHGTNRSGGVAPVTVGLAAEARPLQKNLDNLTNRIVTITASGKTEIIGGGIIAPGYESLGTLEASQTTSGVSDDGTSQSLIDNKLELSSTPERSYTVSESIQARVALELAGAVPALPFRDYLPGDGVRVRLSNVYDAFSASEIQIRINQDGAVTVDDVLGHRFFSPLVKTIKNGLRGALGVIEAGTTTPVGFETNLRALAPTSIAVTTDAAFIAGAPKASATLTWADSTVDVEGTSVEVVGYEVFTRAADAVTPVFVKTVNSTSVTLENLDPGTYTYVTVRPVSSSGVAGVFSEEQEVIAPTPTVALNAPSASSAPTSKLGTVTILWDGKLVDADGALIDPPAQFSHVYAEWATSSGGAYTVGSQNISQAGPADIASLTVGATRWIRLRAVDVQGNVSPASANASVVVAGAIAGDIADDALDGMTADDFGLTGTTTATYVVSSDISGGHEATTDLGPAGLSATYAPVFGGPDYYRAFVDHGSGSGDPKIDLDRQVGGAYDRTRLKMDGLETSSSVFTFSGGGFVFPGSVTIPILITNTVTTLARGGTGATTALAARANLGATPRNTRTRTTTQSIPNATSTPIQYATSVLANTAEFRFSTATFTCQDAGTYRVDYRAQFAANSAGARAIRLLQTGTIVQELFAGTSSSVTAMGLSDTAVVVLGAGDTLSVEVTQSTGAALNITNGHIMIERLV